MLNNVATQYANDNLQLQPTFSLLVAPHFSANIFLNVTDVKLVGETSFCLEF